MENLWFCPEDHEWVASVAYARILWISQCGPVFYFLGGGLWFMSKGLGGRRLIPSLCPAPLYQPPGSRHSASRERFSANHYQSQLQNICPPRDTAGPRGSEMYGMPPVRSEASRLQAFWLYDWIINGTLSIKPSQGAWFIQNPQCRTVREVVRALKVCLSCFQSSGISGH